MDVPHQDVPHHALAPLSAAAAAPPSPLVAALAADAAALTPTPDAPDALSAALPALGSAAASTAAAASSLSVSAVPASPVLGASTAPIHFQAPESLAHSEHRLYSMLEANKEFVARKEYLQYRRKISQKRRIVIVTCMDTRLTYLLPQAMNLRDNDAKIIKNAGAVITHPFGGIMRSIMVAIFELGADEVFVVGHHDCGMTHVDSDATLIKMVDKGIARHTLVTMQYAGIDIKAWLSGFDSIEDSVCNSVDIIRNHPLTPLSVPVHGLIMDPETGLLDLVIDGYKEMPVLTGGVPYAHAEWLASIPPMKPAGVGAAVGGAAGAAGGSPPLRGEAGGAPGDEGLALLQRHEEAIASAALVAKARSSSCSSTDDALASIVNGSAAGGEGSAAAGAAAAAAAAAAVAAARAKARAKANADAEREEEEAMAAAAAGGGVPQPFLGLGIRIHSAGSSAVARALAAGAGHGTGHGTGPSASACVGAGTGASAGEGQLPIPSLPSLHTMSIGRRERPRPKASAIFQSLGVN